MTFNKVMTEIKKSGKKYTNDSYDEGEYIHYVPEEVDENGEKTVAYIAFVYVDNKGSTVTMPYMASETDIYSKKWKAIENDAIEGE